MAAYYCYQCLRKYKKRELPPSLICGACCVELRKLKNKRTRAATVTRLARLRGIKPPTRKDTYDKYLRSPEWKVIRARVLQRDGYRCTLCGARAKQVHHTSYAPAVMAGEDDSKLISVCIPCHEKVHGKRLGKTIKRHRLPAKPGKPLGEYGEAAQCPATR